MTGRDARWLGRLGRGVKALAATVGLAVLLVGVPWALVRYIGWPLPTHVPTWEELGVWLSGPLSTDTFLKVLACVIWPAWASFAIDVVVEVAAEVRGVPAPRLPGGPLQAVAAALVGAMLAGMLATVARGAAATPAGFDTAAHTRPAATMSYTPDPPTSPITTPDTSHGGDTTLIRPAAAGTPATPPAATGGVRDAPTDNGTYTVRTGDSLWDIAARELNDPWRWREIYLLNRGTPQPGGAALTEPDHIEPGWILRMPASTPHEGGSGGSTSDGDTRARYTVTDGDTLWDIAADQLGDPHRWTDIHALNRDRYDMRGGHHIEPGWILYLPTQPKTGPPGAGTPPRPGDGHAGKPPPSGDTPTSSPSGAPSSAPSSHPSQTPTADPGNDGVVAPPKSATPMPPASSPPTRDPSNSSSPPTSPPAGETSRPAQSWGVSLPSGSWLPAGLALALLAAVALVWTLRRRRYIPQPPSPTPRRTDPDLAPLPATVTNLRRAVRNAAGHPDEPADADDTSSHDPLGTISDPGEAAEQPGADGTEPPEDPDWPPPVSLDGPPGHPDGLGLVGPGADAAARGFLAAALTAGGADDPHARAQVVIPAATLATLLGADAVTLPDTPRLTVAPGLPEALDTLDHATLHRTRLAYEHEATTVAEIRHDDPTEEPLPPLLLIADADAAHERARIAALLTQGRRLDVHAVLLGDWPTGHTLHVNTEGTTNPTRPAPHADQQPAVNGCLAVLTPAETADLLTVLAESHTGHPPTPPPAEHAPSRPAHPEEDATPDEPRPVEGAPDPVAAIEGDDGENLTGDQQAPVQPSPTATQTTETQLDAGPALVSVLGAPRIHYNRPPPKEPFRGKARELLVYLAVNDGGATSNAILEDVYGDVPHSRAAHRLHVCVSNLRVHLTHAGGDSGHVQHPRHRYLLNPDEVDTDLRRMQRALADYERGADDPTRIDGLRRAVDAYTGPLADGYEYDWIEPAREAVRRQALDAHLALADLLAPTDPDQALHVLHTAIEHGPHDEAIYRQAMRLYAAKGDTPGLRSLLRSLTERLADIDMEPDETTTDLANQLMAQLRQGKRG